MNAFSEIPTNEPQRLIAGNLWHWKREDLGSDYPNGSYTLKYVARLEGDVQSKSIDATASGDDYLVNLAAADTAEWAEGRWQWTAFITRTSDNARVKIDSGIFIVEPDPEKANRDPRSHAAIVLDKIEQVIENRASKDVQSYSINGRSLSKFSAQELMDLRRTYRKQVIAEKNLQRRKEGKATTNRRVVSFKNG